MRIAMLLLWALWALGAFAHERGAFAHDDDLLDPASRQLADFRKEHPESLGVVTTSAGAPVDMRDARSLNADLTTNQFFNDLLEHSLAERIPERLVHAKGTGAFGHFEVTNDVTQYTSAKFLSKVGKKTPLVARLSIGTVQKGGSDLSRVDLRGFSMKLYTEEGNLDFLCIQVPVYLYKDPLLFGPIVKAFKRNPKTNLNDPTMTYDYNSLEPAGIHSLLWLASEYGLPRGYRKMNAFPIHTYELYNARGERYLARFKFLTQQGVESFTLDEAGILDSFDPDFFMRDLYNAIATKNYPVWKLEMDVMPLDHAQHLRYNPFDVTQLWRNGTYSTVPVGRLVLDRNPDNQFAEVEQAAYNPANLVPGILPPPDQLFKGRTIAYPKTQEYRLGVNRNRIRINRPLHARTYDRDGLPPVRDNGRDSPNYMPNSYHGPSPTVDAARPSTRLVVLESNTADLEQARRFYRYVLHSEEQRERLVAALAFPLARAAADTRDRFVRLLCLVDEELGARVRARATPGAVDGVRLPAVVEDPIPKEIVA